MKPLLLIAALLSGCATCQPDTREAPFAPAAYLQVDPTTRNPRLIFWDEREEGKEDTALYTEQQVLEMIEWKGQK